MTTLLWFVALVGVALATATPYVPQTNAQLFIELDTTVRQQCQANGLHYDVAQVPDAVAYLGADGPVTVTQVMVYKGSQYPYAKRTVMIVCGLSARGFISTEVCMQFLYDLCSLDIPDMSDTRYLVMPYVNERGRYFVHTLYDAFSGTGRPMYWEMQKRLNGGYTLTLQAVVTEVPLSERGVTGPYLACLDGSVRFTMLENNFANGWRPRDLNAINSHLDSVGTKIADDMSSNGRCPESDPETRIVSGLVNRFQPDILITVNAGVPLIAVAFNDPLLAATSLLDDHQLSLVQQALHRAKNVADGSILAGHGAEVRSSIGPAYTGSLLDQSMTLPVIHQFDVNVYQAAPGTGDPTNCLCKLVPTTVEEVTSIRTGWSRRLGQLSKSF